MERPVSRFWSRFTKVAAVAMLVSPLATFANTAQAQTVENASMALTSGTTSEEFGTLSSGGSYTPAEGFPDWASAGGYSFVFTSNFATVAANDTYGTGNLSLDSNVVAPPSRTNFLGTDIDNGSATITDTVTGLTVGKATAVSFVWAGAEQAGAACPGGTSGVVGSGICQADWTVNLNAAGGTTGGQQTAELSYGTQGFTGWVTASLTFIPTATTEILTFLAGGTEGQQGSPPFALLADVSVTTVPEPGSLAIVISGIAGLTLLARRGRARGAGRETV